MKPFRTEGFETADGCWLRVTAWPEAESPAHVTIKKRRIDDDDKTEIHHEDLTPELVRWVLSSKPDGTPGAAWATYDGLAIADTDVDKLAEALTRALEHIA